MKSIIRYVPVLVCAVLISAAACGEQGTPAVPEDGHGRDTVAHVQSQGAGDLIPRSPFILPVDM